MTATPNPVQLPGLKLNAPFTTKFVVSASQPFRITGIDGLGDGITAALPEQQDTTMTLSFIIQPTKAGELRRQLIIRTDLDKESATITLQGEVTP